MNADLDVLKSPLHISKEWIQLLLSKKYLESITVEEFKVVLSEDSAGFLSEVCKVYVKYVKNSYKTFEEYLFFKFLPSDQSLCDFVLDAHLAHREVEFYRFASTELFLNICQMHSSTLFIPQIYFCSMTDDTITIVMNDLDHCNYKKVIIPDGSTVKQTKAVLNSIAVIHAAGLVYLQKHGPINLKPLRDNYFYDQFFIPNLKTLSQMFKDTDLETTFMKLIPHTKYMRTAHFNQNLGSLHTVIHGDLWAGQVQFDKNENYACIFDWQFSSFGNPVNDIMAMFFMSCDVSIFDDHLEEVLKAYWQTLTSVLSTEKCYITVTFQDFIQCIESNWLLGFVYLAVSIHDFLSGSVITEQRIKNVMKFLNRKGVFLKVLERNLDL